MKIEDLEKIKFTTLAWCLLDSSEKSAYMKGFLDCKNKIRQILKEEVEACPECKSVFIQYDKITNECYCLEKNCNHRWKFNFDFNNIKNDYLRISINSNV